VDESPQYNSAEVRPVYPNPTNQIKALKSPSCGSCHLNRNLICHLVATRQIQTCELHAIAKCVNRLLNCAIAKCVNRLLNCAIAKCVIRLLVRQPSVSSVSMCDSYSETPPIAKCLNRIENPQRTLNLLYHSLNALFSLSLSLLQSIPSCHSLFVAYSALLSRV